MIPVYLDYQATTPLDERVRLAMEPYWNGAFGNPHSEGHRYGWEAREAVTRARTEVAGLVGADDGEIVFTSGATESCNLALRGIAAGADGSRRKIVTAATEHPAVLETVRWLGRHGFESVILPVNHDGLLDLTVLEEAVDKRTLLVSVMAANNEIGVLQPMPEIAALCRTVGAVLHSDATQAVGRIGVHVDRLGVDLMSFSGHKVYGPKGVGALYVRNRPGVRVEPVVTGGHQEWGLRAGTVPVPLAVGLGAACSIAADEWRGDADRMGRLATGLYGRMLSTFPDMQVFGDLERRVPGNLNVGFPFVTADDLVARVADRIAISTGSACASATIEPSHVLLALGLDAEDAATGVRISLGRFTTETDVEEASAALTTVVRDCRGARK
ncbi:MAG: cysteine desulfurase family protein [Spirochaetaceae bacterium]|nr:cysteine desulfurase family protein [Spirochaetaceae bacterium]